MDREETITALVRLGAKLDNFGWDDESRMVIEKATEVNGWFSEREIRFAVEAIRTRMLDRLKLEQWLDGYGAMAAGQKKVLVIMAGNIPLVGFFDLLCVVASGHKALVKPSSKDLALTKYIMKVMAPDIPGIVLYDGSEMPDAVIATGSDNTNRYFRSRYRDMPALLRGSRSSFAVLSGDESDEMLAALADDIFLYSGLGCRSVSLLWLPGGYHVERLAGMLSRHGTPGAKYMNNYRQQRALAVMGGEKFIDGHFFILCRDGSFSHAVSRIHYRFYRDLSEIDGFIAANEASTQCIVSGNYAHQLSIPPGTAQMPALTEYPDGVDVMEFLAKI